jgi:hypothetical protein
MKKWARSRSCATKKKDVGSVVDFVKLVRRSRGCAERKRRLSTEDFGLGYNSVERYRQGLAAKGLFEMSQAHQDVPLAETGGNALHTGKRFVADVKCAEADDGETENDDVQNPEGIKRARLTEIEGGREGGTTSPLADPLGILRLRKAMNV